MANNPVRQRYAIGTGGALQAADTRNVTPIKYARGGMVGKTKDSAFYVGTDMNGKRVTTRDKVDAPPKVRGGNFSTAFIGRRVKNEPTLGMPPGGNFSGKRTGIGGAQALKTIGAKNVGNVPTTTVTQKKVAPGFRLHGTKKV